MHYFSKKIKNKVNRNSFFENWKIYKFMFFRNKYYATNIINNITPFNYAYFQTKTLIKKLHYVKKNSN